MKAAVSLVLATVLGAVSGAGGSYLAMQAMPAEPAVKADPAPPALWAYVAMDPVLVPVSDAQGQFSGYVKVSMAIRTAIGTEEAVKARFPEILDHFNRVAWRTPIGVDARRQSLDVDRIRAIGLAAARQTLGSKAVPAVAIVAVEPG
jgi:hypothetical protein